MSDFASRVEAWILESPIDAVLFSEAVVLARAIGSLLALGVSETELREWFESLLSESRDRGNVLDTLDAALGPQEPGIG